MKGESRLPLMRVTIGETLDRIAAHHGQQDAVVSRHQSVARTYRQLHHEVECAARGLMALGVERGDRVGIWSSNCFEWIVTQYAVAKIGSVLVHLNPTYRSGDLEYTLNHSGVSVLITAARSLSTDCVAILAGCGIPAVRRIVCLAPTVVPGWASWNDLISAGETISVETLRAREAAVHCDQVASIMYTSGTTGQPKGVTVTHHGLLNSGFFIGERLRYSQHDRVCLPVPLHHIFGFTLGTLAALTHGSAVVLPGAIFDPKTCFESIEHERCTAFYGVPSMFTAMLRHPQFTPTRLGSLRTGIMAGAPCPLELMREVMTTMHMPEVAICYGLTEAGTLCQSVPDDPAERRVATVGAVHPHIECKVVDPATGHIVQRGMPGELWARGYSVMAGYWNDDAATREIIQPDGWIRTGDLAVMRDDGYLNIVGRLKDMIISGGRNIYPREIEDVLRTHPKIRDVAVIGIPDDVYGEAPCAWIQPHDGEELTTVDVRRFCHERIAPYKIPRYVRLTDQLPMTASGKVQKFRLREMSTVAPLVRRRSN